MGGEVVRLVRDGDAPLARYFRHVRPSMPHDTEAPPIRGLAARGRQGLVHRFSIRSSTGASERLANLQLNEPHRVDVAVFVISDLAARATAVVDGAPAAARPAGEVVEHQ